MGFAGQIFAARVAVGLAMPSPKAFSQAGQMIGGFASNMYTRLGKSSTDAAKKQLSSSQANLAKAKAGLQKHSNEQNKFLEGKAAGAVNRLETAYGKLGKSALKSAGAVKGLKGSIKSTKVKTKLFMNVSEDMKDAKDYQNMMKNFIKMNKQERRTVIEGYEARKIALDNTIAEADVKTKKGKASKTLAEAELKLLNLQLKEFTHLDGVRKNSDDEYYTDKKKHLADIEKATKEVEEAEKDLEQQGKDNVAIQKKMTQAGNDFVVDMKRNFVEAVRESISVLTAFYYKLNENTQELIEFERELMNANSVFRVTNDQLFSVGDQVVQFGQEFGLEMQNGATGLYQLASAGLSAAEAMEVLNDTLKLSMAVQGDHNTISKLVTQTLFGFEMEMNEAGLVADKFAFAIQKSLIEYQDLASAVKFALPFFTSTGQSLDQLLGALQVLTNRALEAGIAGRGLRQGVAELAESIGDNTSKFREFGVEVVDAQGNMLQLTEIAAGFHEVLDEGLINDTELLTALIQQLNVRGATAFVHLVQASDEFTEAVEATTNAGGELDEMIKIQNQSIASQMQILRNNIGMMFLFRDATYENTEYLNAFHEAIVLTVQDFRNLLVKQLEDGTYVMTEFGTAIQVLAIKGIKEMRNLFQQLIPILEGFVSMATAGFKLFKIYLIPVKMIVRALEIMGPAMTKVVLSFHLLSKIIPITTIVKWLYVSATIAENHASTAALRTKMADASATPMFISAGLGLIAVRKLQTFWTNSLTLANIRHHTIDKLQFVLSQHYVNKLLPQLIGRKVSETMAYTHSNRIKQQGILLTIREIATGWAEIAVKKIRFIMSKTIMKHDWLVLGLSQSKNVLKAREVRLENISTLAMVRKFVVSKVGLAFDQIKYAFDMLKLNLNWLLYSMGLKEIALGELNFMLSRKLWAVKLTDFIIDQKRAAQKKINLIWDRLATALTWENIKAKMMEIYTTRIQITTTKEEYSARAFSNWTKTQDFFITVKNTAVEWFWIAAKAAGNAVTKLGTLFLMLVDIPIKIMLALRTTILTALEWLHTSAVSAQYWAQIAKNIVLALGTVIMIGYTIVQWLANGASWSFTFSLLANPVVLIVVGVIALIVALALLAKWLMDAGDLWTVFGQIASHTLGAIMWPFKVIGSLIMKVADAVYGVLEGPLFILGQFLSHLFKFIMYYVKLIGNWFMEKIINPVVGGFKWLWSIIKEYVIDPVVGFFGKIKELLSSLKNPLFTLKEWFMRVFNPLVEVFQKIWNLVKKVFDKIKEIGGKFVKPVMSALGYAEGGYVRPMAKGGLAQHGPYMVGEKGPELFMPRGPGRIIPNKDLNTQRVHKMLGLTDSRGQAVEKAFQKTVGSMKVDILEVKQANLKQSRVGIDTFGGNI